MNDTVDPKLARNAATTLLGVDPVGEVFRAISEAGGEARFVGGVVRDALLGMKPGKMKDIDMASTLLPERATAVLEAAGLHVVPTGIGHGTVTVFRKGAGKSGAVIELTTLREDVETDGRHAKVRFGTDWREDAMRRDFTINSLSLASDGALHDPFGGATDLRAGRVRFVGDARQRIREDYLRILRFFRFYARFGRGRVPDMDAMGAIKGLADGLDRVSGERIARETLGILEAGKVRVLRHMARTSVDRRIAPGGLRPELFGALLRTKEIRTSPAFRLGFLIDSMDDIDLVIERLRLSKRDARQVELGSVGISERSVAGWEAEAWRKLPWRRDNPLPKQLDGNDLACVYAANAIRQGREAAPEVVSDIRGWKAKTFPVSGGDLLGRGVPAGEHLGDLLRQLEDLWVESDFRLSHKDLVKELDTILAKG